MKRRSKLVMGHHAPAPRPTAYAALLVAVALSVPVALVLWIAEWLM